jgi:hypothetical protein
MMSRGPWTFELSVTADFVIKRAGIYVGFFMCGDDEFLIDQGAITDGHPRAAEIETAARWMVDALNAADSASPYPELGWDAAFGLDSVDATAKEANNCPPG